MVELGRLALAPELGRDRGDRRLEDVVQPTAGESCGGYSPLAPRRQLGAEAFEVVEQPPRLVLLREQARELQETAPVMPRLEHLRPHTQSVALVASEQVDLAGVEAELLQPAKPLLEVEPLVIGEDLLVRQFAPEPLVRAEHLLHERERIVMTNVEELAVEVLAREVEVVPALPVRELPVQLAGLRVDEVRGQPACVTAEERVRERAVAPEEAREVQAYEQPRECVEEQVERSGEDRACEHEPVRQRVLEMSRQQHRLVARAALADDADRLHGRYAEVAQRS